MNTDRRDKTGKWNKNFMSVDYFVGKKHRVIEFYDMGPLGRDLALKSCDIVEEFIGKLTAETNS